MQTVSKIQVGIESATYRKLNAIQSQEIIELITLIDSQVDTLLDSIDPPILLAEAGDPASSLGLVELPLNVVLDVVKVAGSHLLTRHPSEVVKPLREFGTLSIQYRRVDAQRGQILGIIPGYYRFSFLGLLDLFSLLGFLDRSLNAGWPRRIRNRDFHLRYA